MITERNLFQRYKLFFNRLNASNRNLDYITNLFFLYTIVPYVTLLFVKLRITPNMTTTLSGTCGALAGILIYNNALIAAGTLIIIHQVLDIVDGNLARLTNKSSPLGAKLDLHFDRLVRTSLLLGVLLATDIQVIYKVVFILTIFMDIFVVHRFVLPFMKKNPLIRSKWKKWFIDRGMIPAFDVFTIYVLLAVFCFLDNLNLFIFLVILGKNIDWLYRVWECYKTKKIYTGQWNLKTFQERS